MTIDGVMEVRLMECAPFSRRIGRGRIWRRGCGG
jgi:hypothetical protein